MNFTPTQQEFGQNLWDVALVGVLNPMEWMVTRSYVKYYAATQTVGLTASYLVAGEAGVDKWMKASNDVFRNRTYLSEIPLVGEYVSILPNPIGVGEVLWNSASHLVHELMDVF